jgi:hypothetical protein
MFIERQRYSLASRRLIWELQSHFMWQLTRAVVFVNLAQNRRHVISEVPVPIMRLEPRDIANPPDMISLAAFIEVLLVELSSADLFAHANGFEHRAVAVPAASDVVDFAAPRIQEEVLESADQVG